MKSRREFMAGLSGIGVAAAMFRGDAIARAAGAGKDAAQTPPHELARDEDYWSQIQRAFDVDRTRINFNNGGVCSLSEPCAGPDDPRPAFSNEMPALHMWSVLEPRSRERPPRPGPRFRLRPRGTRHHPQRLRGDGDPDPRNRPEARRRGDRHRPELRPDAHGLGPARPPRGRRGQEHLLQGPAPLDHAISSTDSPGDHAAGPGSSSSPISSTSPARSCRCARSWTWPGRWVSRCSSTAPTRSPTSRSPATSWAATTSAAACTSGCSPRSAPASSMSARRRSSRSGR